MDAMISFASKHSDIAKVGITVLPGVAKLLEALSKQQDKVTVALVRRSFFDTCSSALLLACLHVALMTAVREQLAQVTGNLQPIGWIKMEALGLRSFFTEPGFGGCVLVLHPALPSSGHSPDSASACAAGSGATTRSEASSSSSPRSGAVPDFSCDVRSCSCGSSAGLSSRHPGARRSTRATHRNRRAAELGRPHSVHWHVGDTPADISAAEYGGARALGVCTGAGDPVSRAGVGEHPPPWNPRN